MPGAATSGFTARSYAEGPRELNVATVSSDRSTVPHVFSAPTVIAYGEFAGDEIPPRMTRPSGAVPGVACGDDHDNPGLHRLVDRFAQRVGGAGFHHGMAERQVDDADVVERAVGDDPFDACDDVAREAAAVGVEHSDVDETSRRARCRRHTPARRRWPAPGCRR